VGELSSTNKYNFLVTAANGDLGEAVAGVLRDSFPGAGIYGVDAMGIYPASMYFDSVSIISTGGSTQYQTELVEVAKKVEATHIIPCSDPEIAALAESSGIKEFRCSILMPQFELVTTFIDKWIGSNWLDSHSFPIPNTVLLTDAKTVDLPLIVKPRLGSGGVGFFRVRSKELLYGLQVEFGDSYIAQEDLGSDTPEYTCAVVSKNGCVNTVVMERRLDAGRTVQITIIKNENVEDIIKRFVDITKLDGPINLQMKETTSGPKIFEINPRFSSTVKMRHLLGFRDLEWLIKSYKELKHFPRYYPQYGMSAYRLSRELLRSS